MADPSRIDIEFDLHEEEEIIDVLETGEKEFLGVVLTDQRLLFAANIEEEALKGEENRLAQKIVGSIQNRFRNGIKLERIRKIEYKGNRLKVRVKIQKFLPTTSFNIDIKDGIEKQRLLEFMDKVKNQAGI
ncbi:MAG: hypothetical protein ACTSRU_14585 [Candidatus Hodarchaeales archaeon]